MGPSQPGACKIRDYLLLSSPHLLLLPHPRPLSCPAPCLAGQKAAPEHEATAPQEAIAAWRSATCPRSGKQQHSTKPQHPSRLQALWLCGTTLPQPPQPSLPCTLRPLLPCPLPPLLTVTIFLPLLLLLLLTKHTHLGPLPGSAGCVRPSSPSLVRKPAYVTSGRKLHGASSCLAKGQAR